MKDSNKSIVASGHTITSETAALLLKAGGNAFDAIVGGGFASAVVEPALTSLGGGGFMVGHNVRNSQDMFFDFFVDCPGKGRENIVFKPDFFPITVDFSGSSQDFNVGLGSVAVPGTLKGLLHIHKRLGKMPLGEVLAPAKKLAEKHRLNEQQAHFLELLYPIMTLTDEGKMIYEPDGEYLKESDLLSNMGLAEFIDQLAVEGDGCFYEGEIAQKIDREMREKGGVLTAEDLKGYRVHERAPLSVPYKDNVYLTAPAPSMGGTLIGLSLFLSEGNQRVALPKFGSGEHLCSTVRLMQDVERLRKEGIITPDSLLQYMQHGSTKSPKLESQKSFSRGTTHISISDKDGNCASMTCSNGEGSGYFAPQTGVMLNNMMGEDDLHPDGFHSEPPGNRVMSMMSPSLLLRDNEVRLVIGSGGSKRIRTAVSQVLRQVVDYKIDLQEAVDAPRLYLDEGLLQLEPGFSKDSVDQVRQLLPVNLWSKKDVYFGGVHCVIPGVCGAGDKRRGGSVVTIDHDSNKL